MRVVLDLNVILDLVMDRSPWSASATSLTSRVLSGALRGYLCATTLTTLFYLVRRASNSDQAILAVRRCLQTFDIAPVDRAVLGMAATAAGRDLEDNVQYAAAVNVHADVIVTRDLSGYPGVSMRVVAPDQLEAELQAHDRG